ncbi:pilus assembly FimT family protein [Aliagarivorans marinus]|uniref:pilus assembly FimT family protein n=1 Tax=Aliagarivorans marinus TaxID=561965 RepID=UPI000684598E|nr:prepilin-type N-terminal cleavage/methylation domain-containing protein [Aliagarivorans marinus]
MQGRIQGFTLIELVSVIAILAILGSTVAPRYISLAQDGEIAVVRGTAAAFSDGVKLAATKGHINGGQDFTNGNVTVNLNNNGWPGYTIMTPGRCRDVWNMVMQEGIEVVPGTEPPSGGYAAAVVSGNLRRCIYEYGSRNPDLTLAFIYDTTNGDILPPDGAAGAFGGWLLITLTGVRLINRRPKKSGQ